MSTEQPTRDIRAPWAQTEQTEPTHDIRAPWGQGETVVWESAEDTITEVHAPVSLRIDEGARELHKLRLKEAMFDDQTLACHLLARAARREETVWMVWSPAEAFIRFKLSGKGEIVLLMEVQA